MNLFLFWQPHLYGYIYLYLYLVLIVVLFSFWVKDLWLKRFVRYGAPLLMLVLDNFFYFFVQVEHKKIRISSYEIASAHTIESSLGGFFFGIALGVLAVSTLAFLCFGFFKMGKVIFSRLKKCV